jgi:hypothetical protein
MKTPEMLLNLFDKRTLQDNPFNINGLRQGKNMQTDENKPFTPQGIGGGGMG